jgi:hypothetical protein
MLLCPGSRGFASVLLFQGKIERPKELLHSFADTERRLGC